MRVGHVTIWRDEPPPPAGRGVARTGVTVIVPDDPRELQRCPVAAGGAVLNGAGEMTGFIQVGELGIIETPVFLTSTNAVGRVFDAAIGLLVDSDPTLTASDALIPIVAECDDSWLNYGRVVQVEAADVARALAEARGREAGPVEEGAVGAGTGMIGFELKGGIGSASREVELEPLETPPEGPPGGPREPAPTYTLGVLALVNFGLLERLTVDGVPVGRILAAEAVEARSRGHDGEPAAVRGLPDQVREGGSCIVVVATDAPLDHHQLERISRRAGLGLARTGSYASHGSGEITLAISTSNRVSHGARRPLRETALVDDEYLARLFAATVEATEEAVINSLVAAPTVVGRDGHEVPGLPTDRLREILAAHGRLGPV